MTDGIQMTTSNAESRKRFARYDRRRFAIILDGGSKTRVLLGSARFEYDQELGMILRIKLDEDLLGNPSILSSERDFRGPVLPDDRHGCDFAVHVVNNTIAKERVAGQSS